MCREVCQWILNNNRKPSQHSDNWREKKYECWISYKRKAKKGTKNKTFYDSDQIIAESYELPDLFKTWNLKNETNTFSYIHL